MPGNFKNTEWALSAKTSAYTLVEYGPRWLYITNAVCDMEKMVYTISFKDLTNSATFSLNYFLLKKDGGDNQMSIKTLNTLGEALAGVNIGIPEPNCIIGGVVFADVEESQANDKGKTYPRIAEFKPVPEHIAACGTIEQYFTDDESGE